MTPEEEIKAIFSVYRPHLRDFFLKVIPEPGSVYTVGIWNDEASSETAPALATARIEGDMLQDCKEGDCGQAKVIIDEACDQLKEAKAQLQ